MSADAQNVWSDLVDYSQSWVPTSDSSVDVYADSTKTGAHVATGEQIIQIAKWSNESGASDNGWKPIGPLEATDHVMVELYEQDINGVTITAQQGSRFEG